jgi:hypothetical protein
MPTKNSSILSLRIRDTIRENAQELADKEGITLHAWAINLIEGGANYRRKKRYKLLNPIPNQLPIKKGG